jgi:hypothetical protein
LYHSAEGRRARKLTVSLVQGNGESDYTPPSSPTNQGSLQMRLKNFQRTAKQYMPEANGT